MLNFKDKNILFLNHFYELRYRIYYYIISNIITTLVAYEYSTELIYLFARPLLINKTHEVNQLIYTNITEAFFTFLNISLFSSIFLTIPILLYQVFFYLLPGLYEYEKENLSYIIYFMLIMILINLAIIYFLVLPIIWSFFLEFDNTMSQEVFKIKFEGKINEYITLVENLIISFAICSQIPVILIVLINFNLLNFNVLVKARSFMVITCLILGAMLSPPDVFSQVILAIPLYFSYEFGIFFAIFKKNSFTTIL